LLSFLSSTITRKYQIDVKIHFIRITAIATMTCYCRGLMNSKRELQCDDVYSIEKKEEYVVIEEVKVAVGVAVEVEEGEEEERYGTSCSS
jgi:hypothetical protein